MLNIASAITLIITTILTLDKFRRPLTKVLGSYLFKESVYYPDHKKIRQLEKTMKHMQIQHYRYVIENMIEDEEDLYLVLQEYDIYKQLGGNGYIEEIVTRYKHKKDV